MDKFLERHKLPELTQEEIEHVNRYSEETELVIKEFTNKKTQTQLASPIYSPEYFIENIVFCNSPKK